MGDVGHRSVIRVAQTPAHLRLLSKNRGAESTSCGEIESATGGCGGGICTCAYYLKTGELRVLAAEKLNLQLVVVEEESAAESRPRSEGGGAGMAWQANQ